MNITQTIPGFPLPQSVVCSCPDPAAIVVLSMCLGACMVWFGLVIKRIVKP